MSPSCRKYKHRSAECADEEGNGGAATAARQPNVARGPAQPRIRDGIEDRHVATHLKLPVQLLEPALQLGSVFGHGVGVGVARWPRCVEAVVVVRCCCEAAEPKNPGQRARGVQGRSQVESGERRGAEREHARRGGGLCSREIQVRLQRNRQTDRQPDTAGHRISPVTQALARSTVWWVVVGGGGCWRPCDVVGGGNLLQHTAPQGISQQEWSGWLQRACRPPGLAGPGPRWRCSGLVGSSGQGRASMARWAPLTRTNAPMTLQPVPFQPLVAPGSELHTRSWQGPPRRTLALCIRDWRVPCCTSCVVHRRWRGSDPAVFGARAWASKWEILFYFECPRRRPSFNFLC